MGNELRGICYPAHACTIVINIEINAENRNEFSTDFVRFGLERQIATTTTSVLLGKMANFAEFRAAKPEMAVARDSPRPANNQMGET